MGAASNMTDYTFPHWQLDSAGDMLRIPEVVAAYTDSDILANRVRCTWVGLEFDPCRACVELDT